MNRAAPQEVTVNPSAMVWCGPEKGFEPHEIPPPEHLATGSVLVEVRLATICGSDLHTVAGDRPGPTPSILGHEVVGEVVEVGGAAHDVDGEPVRPGDKVTWTINTACGTCRRCRRGLPNKCATLRKYGHEPLTAAWSLNGGFARYCELVPGTAVVRVPRSMPDRLAAPANCATATVVGALRRVGAGPDDALVVLGCGMLGLTAVAYARHLGLATVIACDPDPRRRSSATGFGADAVAAPDELARLVADRTGGEGADVVLEVSGHPAAVAQSISLLGIGGRLSLVGSVSPGPELTLAPESLVRNLITVNGSHNYLPADLAAAIDFLDRTDRATRLADLVGASFPLEDLPEAVAAARGPDAPPRVAVAPRP